MAQSSGPSALHPGGWAAVPIALLRHADATASDIAVFVAIASGAKYVGGVGVSRMWTTRIVERSHLSRRSVRRAVVRLEETLKVLAVVRRPGFANEYVLLPTAPSSEERSDEALEAARRMGGRPPKDPTKAPKTPATEEGGYAEPPAPVAATPATSGPSPGHQRPPSTDLLLDVSSDPEAMTETTTHQKTAHPGIEQEAMRRMSAVRARGVDIANEQAYLTKIVSSLIEEGWQEDTGIQYSIAWQEQRRRMGLAPGEQLSRSLPDN